MSFNLHHGDCLEIMAKLPDSSVDCVLTDPPYELGFMGKAWDKSGVANDPDTWREVLRVLKPGGHLLAFGGTRTYHRMACAIEDAGFEIRDQIQWIYGSGFPKSLDVSKQIDKMRGAEREVVGIRKSEGGCSGSSSQTGTAPLLNCSSRLRGNKIPITTAATDEAKQWDGWGTALKPANEPICLARKPLEKGLTVAQNVLKWGTGAINIDKCRVEFQSAADAADAAVGFAASRARGTARQSVSIGKESRDGTNNYDPTKLAGRFPANVIHDGSDEVLAGFPQTTTHGGGTTSTRGIPFSPVNSQRREPFAIPKGGSGSAARFFYCAKASRSERGDNNHPTVKPIKLMAYLCKLITPPNGVVLDLFMGSGSTGVACELEGRRFIGIERDEGYFEIAKERIEGVAKKEPLFMEVAA